jgi:hypothetical protein
MEKSATGVKSLDEVAGQEKMVGDVDSMERSHAGDLEPCILRSGCLTGTGEFAAQ